MYFALEYDYFLKDHLGNIRSVITEGKDTATYVATMEPAYQTTEQALFDNEYDPVNTIVAKPSGFDNTGTNTKVVRLNASTGVAKPNGPGLLLKVMAGDKVQLSVYAWYSGTVQGPGGVNPFNDLLSAITGSVIGGSSGKLSSTINTSVSNAISPNLTTFINNRNYNSTRPKAHLNWILLDEQLNYVQQGGNAVQVPTVSAGAQKQAIAPMLQTMSKSGYLYVYLSNESQMDVYFDDLTVTHYSSALVSEESYYPFGGDMAALKSNAAMKTVNRYKFNAGTELNESFDIDYYETYFRNYDAQVGRFTRIDGLAEEYLYLTPYHFAGNNPISYNDPTGLKMNSMAGLSGTALAYTIWLEGVAKTTQGTGMGEVYQEQLDGMLAAADFARNNSGGGSQESTFSSIHISKAGQIRLTFFKWVPKDINLHEAYIVHQPSYFEGEKGEVGLEGDLDDLITTSYSLDKFIEMANKPGFMDYLSTSLGALGGVVEAGIGVVTSEFGVGVALFADGGYRALANTTKLVELIRNGKKEANGIPANILAVIGKIIDDNNNPNSVGPWQKGLGYANDAISLFAPAGDKYTSLAQLNYFLNDPVIGYNTAINTWVPAGVDAINSITIP